MLEPNRSHQMLQREIYKYIKLSFVKLFFGGTPTIFKGISGMRNIMI